MLAMIATNNPSRIFTHCYCALFGVTMDQALTSAPDRAAEWTILVALVALKTATSTQVQ